MKFNIEIDKRYKLVDGTYPIKLRIYQNRKYAYIPLNISCPLEDFEDGVVKTSNKHTKLLYQKYNVIIQGEMTRANVLYNDLMIKNKHGISADAFKQMMLNDIGGRETIKLLEYIEKIIPFKSKGNAEVYKNTHRVIKEYVKEDIYFEDVNFNWLEKFESYLIKKGNSINTISITLRTLKAVFNHAIDNEVIGLDVYPFRRFKIKTETTQKRAISVEQIRSFFEPMGLPNFDSSIDVCKIIFCLIGINTVDLCSLTHDSYDGTYIYYKRAKTGTNYQLKVEPELDELMQKYKGKTRLFSFAENLSTHRVLTSRLNIHLKTICKQKGLPRMVVYTFRHTWATLASELEIPKETISASLGHAQNSVTDVYIAFNRKKIDEANRKVLNYVFN